MKSLLFSFLFLAAISVSIGQDFPEPMDPPRLVNDFAGVLSDNEFRNLEAKLERYEDTTSNQIAIVIIRSTGPYDIGQYSAELGERWGVGEKGKDNGILILAAIEDRDIYISTGYGLEPSVPDAAARRIIQDYIIPNFRNQDYYRGFDEATSVIISLAAGEFTADQMGGGEGMSRKARRSLFTFLLPIILITLLSFSRYRRMARHHYGHDAGFWAILALMMSSGGGRGRSNWDNFSGGSGTFGGGGGFGGFGGGSFGGGGAGGSW